jgi:ankyrin repeat protein
MYAAACLGLQKVVETLLYRGADIKSPCGEYGNALQAACVGGHVNIVALLIHKGADVNAKGGKYGTFSRPLVLKAMTT